MIIFDMVDHEGFVLENISTLKAAMLTLVKDDVQKTAFTVILTFLAREIFAGYTFLVMRFFAVIIR